MKKWLFLLQVSSQCCLFGLYIKTCFQDTRLVIEKFKSGFSPPGDIPFEDLNHDDTSGNNGPSARNGGGGTERDDADSRSINGSMASMPIPQKKSLIGTITGNVRKRSGLRGLFAASKVRQCPTCSFKENSQVKEQPSTVDPGFRKISFK